MHQASTSHIAAEFVSSMDLNVTEAHDLLDRILGSRSRGLSASALSTRARNRRNQKRRTSSREPQLRN
jgi:hypothetical protein